MHLALPLHKIILLLMVNIPIHFLAATNFSTLREENCLAKNHSFKNFRYPNRNAQVYKNKQKNPSSG